MSPEMVAGKWYYEAAQHGTYGEGDDAFEFEKVVIYGNLRADGTGSWYALFFNAYNNLIDTGNLFFGAGCQYATAADGSVYVTLSNCKILCENRVVDRHPAIICRGSVTLS